MKTEDGVDDDVVDWAILKSIQEANAASMGALEEYLLLVSHPDTVGSAEETRRLLERSIANHEQVIEQLDLAIGELETNAGPGPE